MPRLRDLLVVGAALGCDTTDPGSGPQPGFVAVGDDYFSPSTVHPAANGLVTWVWGGQRTHNIVFADGIGDHPAAVASGVHMRDFSAATHGTYPYACTLHSGMQGSVVVP